jgi:hypothetical protein
METRYSAIELLRQAIKEEIPVVIVEGPDDIKIYNKLAKETNKEVVVKAVEFIEGGEGANCHAIFSIISKNDFQSEIKKKDNRQWLLGIIDGDTIEYKSWMKRESIENIIGLYQLKLYSFESYFVSEHNLKHLLVTITRMGSMSKITDITINYFLKKFKPIEEMLFQISIDNLIFLQNDKIKSSLDSMKINEIINNPKVQIDLKERSKNINDFIETNNIDFEKDKKKIIKGKKLFQTFYEIIRMELKAIPDNCRKISVDNCDYCSEDKKLREKCLWKTTQYSNYDQFKPIVYLNTDNPEFNEIKNVINALGNP